MTFKEKYHKEDTWYGRVMVMELYHLTMTHRIKRWTLAKTAEYFECSVGLVSENLKLAHAFHINHELIKFDTRQQALDKIR